MGLRLSFGFGPLRASVPLSGRRRRRGPTKAQIAAQQKQQQIRANAKARAAREREYNLPENVAAREAAKAERAARTRRGVITECTIDPLKGGKFVLTDAEGSNANVEVGPGFPARDFLSLKKGDLAEITWRADGSGIENFMHIARANGATPRNPAGEWSSGRVHFQ